jgi:hypothetical protein
LPGSFEDVDARVPACLAVHQLSGSWVGWRVRRSAGEARVSGRGVERVVRNGSVDAGVLIWREIRLRDAVMGRRDVDPDADANGRMRDSIVLE